MGNLLARVIHNLHLNFTNGNICTVNVTVSNEEGGYVYMLMTLVNRTMCSSPLSAFRGRNTMHHVQKIFGICNALLLQEYLSLCYSTFLKEHLVYEDVYNIVRGHELYVPKKNRLMKKVLKKLYILLKSYNLDQSWPPIFPAVNR